ncbi:MAG: DUF5320 domain-containing protein [Desulfurococcaceae archaeon TW002]
MPWGPWWCPWWRYRHWAGAKYWWYYGAPPAWWYWRYPSSTEEERRFLEALKEDLEAELNEIRKRIEELQKKPSAT